MPFKIGPATGETPWGCNSCCDTKTQADHDVTMIRGEDKQGRPSNQIGWGLCTACLLELIAAARDEIRRHNRLQRAKRKRQKQPAELVL